MATRSIESAYSYERVRDPKLRAFMEGSVEPAIQQVVGWPVAKSKVPMIFSAAFGLDKYKLFQIIQVAGSNGVLDLVRGQEGQGNGARYILDQDGVRIIGTLSWEFAQSPSKKTPLTERIDRVVEALGGHPLREKLNFSLLTPKPLLSSLPPAQNNTKEEVVTDEEQIVVAIESKAKPRLGSVPYIDEKELEEGRFWALAELEKLLPYIPEGWEQVSSTKIPQLFDGHPYNYAVLLQIMFIGAVWARNPRELRLFDPQLENLNYDQLRLGVSRCIALLGRRPAIKNITELFQVSVRWVQSRQQTT